MARRGQPSEARLQEMGTAIKDEEPDARPGDWISRAERSEEAAQEAFHEAEQPDSTGDAAEDGAQPPEAAAEDIDREYFEQENEQPVWTATETVTTGTGTDADGTPQKLILARPKAMLRRPAASGREAGGDPPIGGGPARGTTGGKTTGGRIIGGKTAEGKNGGKPLGGTGGNSQAIGQRTGGNSQAIGGTGGNGGSSHTVGHRPGGKSGKHHSGGKNRNKGKDGSRRDTPDFRHPALGRKDGKGYVRGANRGNQQQMQRATVPPELMQQWRVSAAMVSGASASNTPRQPSISPPPHPASKSQPKPIRRDSRSRADSRRRDDRIGRADQRRSDSRDDRFGRAVQQRRQRGRRSDSRSRSRSIEAAHAASSSSLISSITELIRVATGRGGR